MEADLSQAILAQYNLEVLCDEVGRVGNAKIVDVDVIRLSVAVTAQLLTAFLPLLHHQKKITILRHQRHGAAAGFVLSPFLGDDFCLTSGSKLDYRVVNRNRIVLKVDSLPTQSHDFTAAKPVERSHQDRELNRVAFDHLEKSFHLSNRVKRSGVRQAFGPIHLIQIGRASGRERVYGLV